MKHHSGYEQLKRPRGKMSPKFFNRKSNRILVKTFRGMGNWQVARNQDGFK